MAKIKILGDAVVIVSSLKLEDIETVKKYDPKKLILMGGKDGDEPVFAIGTTACPSGTLNSVSAAFGGETHDAQKFATITTNLTKWGIDASAPVEEIRDAVADKFGALLTQISAIEEGIPAALTGIRENVAKIKANISME